MWAGADIDVVQDALSAFPKGRRASLRIIDYAYVLMAEGMIWVSEENIERAFSNFNLVLSLRTEITDPQVLALAHFWSSRCNRKAGEYDHAMPHAGEGHRSLPRPAWNRWRRSSTWRKAGCCSRRAASGKL